MSTAKAVAWLRQRFADGAQPATLIRTEAAAAGHSWRLCVVQNPYSKSNPKNVTTNGSGCRRRKMLTLLRPKLKVLKCKGLKPHLTARKMLRRKVTPAKVLKAIPMSADIKSL
jgi:hypothetical protein